MKRLLILIGLAIGVSSGAQVLKVPTLESKGINGDVTSIELAQFDFKDGEGLIQTKTDIEVYDENGRLSSVFTTEIQNNRSYKTLYQLTKKGLLEEVRIVNPENNVALRTTTYAYKKGNLSQTSQVQGNMTIEKTYVYDKQDRIVEVETVQNGNISLNEYYEYDGEGRRTKISRKLASSGQLKVASTFTYEVLEGKKVTIEKRNTAQGEYEIRRTTDLSSNRDIKEETTKISANQKGWRDQVYADDNQGNWIKGEVVDDNFGRSRLVLRKITYKDNIVTGRIAMQSPEDDRGQFLRRGTNKQLAINGKIVYTGSPTLIPNSKDRLFYIASLSMWVKAKDYTVTSNMSKWGELEVMSTDPSAVIYIPGQNGASYYKAGNILTSGNGVDSYSAKQIGGSTVAYVRSNIHKSLVIKETASKIGSAYIAEFSDQMYYWGKSSDSTYNITGFGKSIFVGSQIEDDDGNLLVFQNSGLTDSWYLLSDFRNKFDSGKPGDIYPALFLTEPEKTLSEKNLFTADFSGFTYDKLKGNRYSLRSHDGQIVTNLVHKGLKAPVNNLIAYYPFNKMYLRLEKYYELDKEQEHPDQKVEIMSSGSRYAYHIHSEGKKINFYRPGERFSKYKFSSFKLSPEKSLHGAAVYDSLENTTYTMTYDLTVHERMGPMKRRSYVSSHAFLLKLEGERWVIFQKGSLVPSYDYSFSDDDDVIHFFKDENGVAKAWKFQAFKDASSGDFISGENLLNDDLKLYLDKLQVDPTLPPKEKN